MEDVASISSDYVLTYDLPESREQAECYRRLCYFSAVYRFYLLGRSTQEPTPRPGTITG